MSYLKKYAIDNRTEEKAHQDFNQGKKNERAVMTALVDYYFLRGIKCRFRAIDEYEEWLDDRKHTLPDFYFFKGDKLFSVEVKFSTTGNFLNDLIYIKPNPFWTCKKYPNPYPNFKAIVATKSRFTVIDASEFTEDKLSVAQEWSADDFEKMVFKFPVKRRWFYWDNIIDL
jgi:hypothetical protein